MKKFFLIILIIFLYIQLSAFDADSYLYSVSDNVGFAFLKIMPDAEYQSYLGGGTAGYNSTSSYLINPAIPAYNNENQKLSFSYKNSFNFINYGFINYIQKLNKGHLFFGTGYLHTDSMQLRGENPTEEPLGDFNFSSLTFSIGYGILVNKGVYWGAYIRSISEISYSMNFTSYVLNTGFLFTFDKIKGLSIGLSFLNIGYQTRYEEYSADYIIPPFTVRFGIKNITKINDDYSLTLLSDFEKINDAEYTVSSGICIAYMDQLFLRTGFKTNDISREFSIGIGLKVNKFAIDYAFTPYKNTLGYDNIITLNYIF